MKVVNKFTNSTQFSTKYSSQCSTLLTRSTILYTSAMACMYKADYSVYKQIFDLIIMIKFTNNF